MLRAIQRQSTPVTANSTTTIIRLCCATLRLVVKNIYIRKRVFFRFAWSVCRQQIRDGYPSAEPPACAATSLIGVRNQGYCHAVQHQPIRIMLACINHTATNEKLCTFPCQAFDPSQHVEYIGLSITHGGTSDANRKPPSMLTNQHSCRG